MNMETLKTLKLPLHKTEEEQLIWLKDVFSVIVDNCRKKHVTDYRICIDYGGHYIQDKEEKPCIKTWTLKDMKNWLKSWRKNNEKD